MSNEITKKADSKAENVAASYRCHFCRKPIFGKPSTKLEQRIKNASLEVASHERFCDHNPKNQRKYH